MKRGQPLQRKTPLRAKKRAARSGAIARRKAEADPKPKFKGRRAFTEREIADRDAEWALWDEVRRLIFLRSGGRCELCGTETPWDRMEGHHRRSRGVKGEHRHCACNAVALCRGCHHGPRVHAGPEEARLLGTILSKLDGRAPHTVPVDLRRGRSWLSCWGTYERVG